MKTRKVFFVLGCILSFLVVTAVGPYVEKANAEVTELSLATFVPPKHCINTTAQAWADEIAKRTGGRVKAKLFPAQALLSAEKMYEGVVSGAADLGITCFTYNVGLFPVMMVLDTAIGIPSAKVGTKVANAFYRKYQPKELSDLKVIYLFTCSPVGIAFNRPVRTIAELKGKIIRGPGGQAPYLNAFGSKVVALPMSEALMSIRKNMVDGCTVSLDVLKPMKIGEAAKYVTMTEHSVTSFWFGMNLAKWNSLPATIQKVINEVSEEWIDRAGSDWDKAAAEGAEYIKSEGGEIIQLSKEDKALREKILSPVANEYAENLIKKGFPGKEMVRDAIGMTKQY
jgi:TRAP-type C4-dicarboxylate transport system substrate-binding protein